MKLPGKYVILRAERRALVIKAVLTAVELSCLRGSWVTGDFHLDMRDGLSLSDVDLAATEASPISDQIRQSISDRLEEAGFPLRVSAHREEALSRVTLEDARVLKIAEYLSKTHAALDNPRLVSYWRAKSVLLLLQAKVNEGYEAISNRLNTKEARSALAVKIGTESIFSRESAARLIRQFGDGIALDFMEHCLIRDSEPAYHEEIAGRLSRSKSVSPWLLDYVLEKMGLKTP